MMSEIVMLAVGLVVGAVAIWLIFKAKVQAAADKAKAEGDSDRSGLTATLQARDSQIQGLSSSVEKSNADNTRLQTELTTESNKRATAEEKNSRIPILETDLNEKAVKITELLGKVTNLKEALAGLTTSIEAGRETAAEKLALLTDAQQKLGDSFKALSSDALKSNNQSFLELANTTLEKFQQGAQTDLTTRQPVESRSANAVTIWITDPISSKWW
jgi:DNA recombination protein RmuC